MYVCMYMRMCVCMHVCMCVCVFVYVGTIEVNKDDKRAAGTRYRSAGSVYICMYVT